MKMMKDYCLANDAATARCVSLARIARCATNLSSPLLPPAHHRRTRNRRAATVIRNLEARYSQIINFRTAAIQTLSHSHSIETRYQSG